MAAKKKTSHLDGIILPNIKGVILEKDDSPEWEPPKPNQATRIINKFGGHKQLFIMFKELGIERSIQTIYKWTYPKNKRGTGGVIPHTAWADLWKAARYAGIILTSEDMDPRDNAPSTNNPRVAEFTKRKKGLATRE